MTTAPFPVDLGFVTDARGFGPLTMAVASAVAHTRGAVTVHLLGHEIPPEPLARLRVRVEDAGARLAFHALDAQMLEGATSPKDFIPPVSLGRMYLPRLVERRVLYLDTDVLVTGDLSPLFALDLGGQPLGAVRDYVVLRRALRASVERVRARLSETAALMAPEPAAAYFNSGVLLLDCAAIRAEPELQAQMEDLRAAGGYATVDQDRLNLIFKGRVRHLDPRWNCSWGRLGRQRSMTGALWDAAELEAGGARVLHFHGPLKPWKTPLHRVPLRGIPAALAYRRAARRLSAA